jgi:hypothetical protein
MMTKFIIDVVRRALHTAPTLFRSPVLDRMPRP